MRLGVGNVVCFNFFRFVLRYFSRFVFVLGNFADRQHVLDAARFWTFWIWTFWFWALNSGGRCIKTILDDAQRKELVFLFSQDET